MEITNTEFWSLKRTPPRTDAELKEKLEEITYMVEVTVSIISPSPSTVLFRKLLAFRVTVELSVIKISEFEVEVLFWKVELRSVYTPKDTLTRVALLFLNTQLLVVTILELVSLTTYSKLVPLLFSIVLELISKSVLPLTFATIPDTELQSENIELLISNTPPPLCSITAAAVLLTKLVSLITLEVAMIALGYVNTIPCGVLIQEK